MNVVANAIYYNPVLALHQLQQQGRTQQFFAMWFQVRRTPISMLSQPPADSALIAGQKGANHISVCPRSKSLMVHSEDRSGTGTLVRSQS